MILSSPLTLVMSVNMIKMILSYFWNSGKKKLNPFNKILSAPYRMVNYRHAVPQSLSRIYVALHNKTETSHLWNNCSSIPRSRPFAATILFSVSVSWANNPEGCRRLRDFSGTVVRKSLYVWHWWWRQEGSLALAYELNEVCPAAPWVLQWRVYSSHCSRSLWYYSKRDLTPQEENKSLHCFLSYSGWKLRQLMREWLTKVWCIG